MMLKQLLRSLQPVHRAETGEEREAVYGFFSQVDVEKLCRELASPDHERKWQTDAETDSTTILYTGTVKRIAGTVRLRHWRAGEVPRSAVEELSMDRFPDIEERNTATIDGLAVRKLPHQGVIIASLLAASYEILAGEQETDLAFCYCSPRLLRYYQPLAMRPFGGLLVDSADGRMLPLVTVLSDLAYFVRMRSLLAPLVPTYFGRGKRPPLPLESYRHLFTCGSELHFEPERVLRKVQEVIAASASEAIVRRRSVSTPAAPSPRSKVTLPEWWRSSMAARPASGRRLLASRPSPSYCNGLRHHRTGTPGSSGANAPADS